MTTARTPGSPMGLVIPRAHLRIAAALGLTLAVGDLPRTAGAQAPAPGPGAGQGPGQGRGQAAPGREAGRNRRPRRRARPGLIVPYPFPPALIIRQTPEAHDEVDALLRMLRGG